MPGVAARLARESRGLAKVRRLRSRLRASTKCRCDGRAAEHELALCRLGTSSSEVNRGSSPRRSDCVRVGDGRRKWCRSGSKTCDRASVRFAVWDLPPRSLSGASLKSRQSNRSTGATRRGSSPPRSQRARDIARARLRREVGPGDRPTRPAWRTSCWDESSVPSPRSKTDRGMPPGPAREIRERPRTVSRETVSPVPGADIQFRHALGAECRIKPFLHSEALDRFRRRRRGRVQQRPIWPSGLERLIAQVERTNAGVTPRRHVSRETTRATQGVRLPSCRGAPRGAGHTAVSAGHTAVSAGRRPEVLPVNLRPFSLLATPFERGRGHAPRRWLPLGAGTSPSAAPSGALLGSTMRLALQHKLAVEHPRLRAEVARGRGDVSRETRTPSGAS